MYTGKVVSWFPTRVVAGADDFQLGLENYFENGVVNAVKRIYGTNGVMLVQQTATYLAGPPDTISLAVAEKHYVSNGWFLRTIAGAMEGCSSMAFLHDGASLYYIGMRHNRHPSTDPAAFGVRQGKSGANVYAIAKIRDSIGELGNPGGVTWGGGNLTFQIDAIAKSIWTDAGTREVVIWKDDPVTDGVEAIWEGTCHHAGGHIVAVVPHSFGQGTTPSVVVGDYWCLVKGATITTVDISANTNYAFLGTFDCATDAFDYSWQNVISSTGVNALDLWQLAQDLYPTDVPAPSLDHDGVANMAVSLGNNQRRDRQLLDTIFGIADFLGGTYKGFGRACGIVLNTDRAGYVAFNPIAGITEALGTVTVVLAKNTIDNHEVVFTQGAPATRKTAVDWTNYQYVPAADGYYCVYFDISGSFVYADATKGWYCEITTAIDAGAISPTDAMNRRLANGYLPVYGYEIAAGAMVNEVAFPLMSICGIGYQDKLQGQWEVRNEVIPIGHADLGVTATKVMNAPPTPSVEISLPAALDYCYIPIQFPAGYMLNEVLVDIDPDIAAGANNTVEGRLYRNGAAISAVYSWIGARTVLTVVPTAEVVYSAPAGAPDTGIVYLAIICTVHAGGDARVYGVSANFTRCME